MKKKTVGARILKIMTDNGGRARPADLVRELNVTQASVQRQLRKLVEEGVIEKIGVAPKVYYQLRSRSEFGPDKDLLFPNPKLRTVAFIKNLPPRKNVEIGDYTYYADSSKEGPECFYERVTHHYEFLGDKLIIGKFCAIGEGVEFMMNGANHRLNSITTYPFNIFGRGWQKVTPEENELPLKGNTVIGNDVWIGEQVTFMPGVKVGNGAIIGAKSVVTKDVPAYGVVAGNPAKLVRMRFSDEEIEKLERIAWWNWDEEKIFRNLGKLTATPS